MSVKEANEVLAALEKSGKLLSVFQRAFLDHSFDV